MIEREVWDDGQWFEGYEERDERPLPPGVYVQVPAGTHTEVTLPDGTIHRLPCPITMSSAGSIFIPDSE